MRAITRHRLAPLVIAAAFLSVGAAAQHTAAVPAHRTAVLAIPYCPNGTNWDNYLQSCV